MKRKAILRSFGLLLLSVFTVAVAQSQNTFNHRYRFDFPAAVLTSIVPTDSCYYATGIIADSIFPYNTGNIFTKLDLEGNVEFIKTIRDTAKTYETWYPTLIQLENQKFTVSGYSFDSLMKAIFIVYNDLGDSLVYKEYQNFFQEDQFVRPNGLAKDVNNHFIFSNQEANPTAGFQNTDVVLLKVDSLGNQLWRYAYGTATYREIPETIVSSNDGASYVGCQRTNTNTNNQNFISQNYIFKINQQGQVLWEYLSPPSQLLDAANAIVLTEDGGMIIATQKGVEIPANANNGSLRWKSGLVYKLDANRNKIWEVEFKDPTNPIFNNKLSKLLEVSDSSGYIAAGNFGITYPDLTADLFGWLVKVSPEGDSLWSRSLRVIQTETSLHYLYDLKETTDGGFVMVGEAFDTENYYPQQAWLIKVDQYGCLVPGCHLLDAVEALEEIPSIRIYPNPASDYLNIYLPKSNTSKSSYFQIVNIQGILMQTIEHIKTDITYMLPITQWPNGTYFIQYFEENQLLYTTKFMKQD